MNIKRFLAVLLLILSVNFIIAERPYQAPHAYIKKDGSNKDFNFALFSDLHISVEDQKSKEDLSRAIKEVNLDESIAFVLIAGDITANGDRKSLSLAKELLDKLECKYFLVPGNRDTKWSESGATDFRKIFGDDKFRLQMNGYLFLGVNTGPTFKMGDGHVDVSDIVWTQRQLKNVGKKMPIFVIAHHPLKTGDVDNWYDYTDVLRKHNIQAVLNGHYHTNMLSNYDGILGIINRSVLRGDKANSGFNLYSMASDTLYIYEKIVGQSPVNLATIPVVQKMYVEGDTKLFPRPEYKVNSEFSKVKREWVINEKCGVYTSPFVCENKVIYGDRIGNIKCVSYDKGKEIWSFRAISSIISSPIVSENKVVFGSTDNTIYCLDVNTGKLLWSVYVKSSVLGTPEIKDGVVYIGASDGNFRALNLETGDEMWIFNEITNYQESKPIVFDNKVMFGAWDNTFYCLDKNNGNVLWKWNNAKKGFRNSPAAVWAVNTDDKVFIVTPDGIITALDIEKGNEVWSSNKYKVRESIGISEDKKLVYAKTINDTVIAINTEISDFKEVWVRNVDYDVDNNSSALSEKDGKLVFATKNGMVYCLNSLNGDILWKHKIDNAVINKIYSVDANNWVLTTVSSKIVRLRLN